MQTKLVTDIFDVVLQLLKEPLGLRSCLEALLGKITTLSNKRGAEVGGEDEWPANTADDRCHVASDSNSFAHCSPLSRLPQYNRQWWDKDEHDKHRNFSTYKAPDESDSVGVE